MSNNKHHPFGPSSLERRDLCPGSWEVEQAIPDMTTPEASSGTRLHGLIASVLSSSREFTEADCTDEEVALINKCIDLENELCADKKELWIEQHLTYYDYDSQPLYDGTADVVCVKEEEVLIIDWKTGFNPVVEAANNLQGAAYALAAMQKYSKTKATVVFFNPRINQRTQHTFTNWKGIRDEIKAIIDKCKAKDRKLCPSETACKYCKGALSGSCPMLKEKTVELSALGDSGRILKAVKDLPEESLISYFEACKVAQKFIDSVTDEVKARAEANGRCGDYIIKTTSGGFDVVNIQAAFRASGLTPDQFLGCCAVSLPKLKKEYSKDYAGGTKKEAEQRIMDKIAPYLQAKPERKILTKIKE